MPANARAPDTITARDFALQLAEREAMRRMRSTAFRLIGGIIAGLAVASIGLHDTGNELVYIVMGMGTAFLVICGYTPRILRRSNAYIDGVRGQMERDARGILYSGILTSPRLFALQRKTRVINILRGLVLVGLLLPFPVSRLIASHTAIDNPPSHSGPNPAPQTLRELHRQIETAKTTTPSPVPQPATHLTPTVTAPNPIENSDITTRQIEARVEYLVRHTDRRFYGVGP